MHEENHPDWIPTVKMGYDMDAVNDARYNRLQQRRRKQSELQEAEEMQAESDQCEEMSSIDPEAVGETTEHPDVMEEVQLATHQNTEVQASMLEKKEVIELRKENTILRKEVEVLSKFYNQHNQLFEEKLKDDEKLLKFYTGKSNNIYYKSKDYLYTCLVTFSWLL